MDSAAARIAESEAGAERIKTKAGSTGFAGWGKLAG